MKKTNFFLMTTIIFMLVVLNVSLLVKYKRLKTNNQEICANIDSIKSFESNCQHQIKLLKEMTIQQFSSSNIELPEDIVFTTIDNKKIKLKELINKHPKLVFRFSERNCNSCIEFVLEEIEKFSKRVGKNNIAIIASYKDLKNLLLFKDTYKCDFEIYNLDNFQFSIEELNLPFLFVIDDQYFSRAVFTPDSQFPVLLDNYLSSIKINYFMK